MSLATFSLSSAFVSIKMAIDDVIECHQWKLHRIKSYKFSLRADVQYGVQLIRQHAPAHPHMPWQKFVNVLANDMHRR